MLTTQPAGHNKVALLCDGFIVFIGSAAEIRRLMGVQRMLPKGAQQ